MGQNSKNCLKGSRVYLSGAIDRCPDLGISWRQWLSKELTDRYNVICYNPMMKPLKIAGEHENRELRKQWKANGEYNKLADFIRQIRHVDLRLCDRSDWGVFYLDLDIYATGTFEELFLMNKQKKPILIVCKQGKANVPDWLYGAINHNCMFSVWGDMFEYLNKIDQGWDDGTNRWLCFDY